MPPQRTADSPTFVTSHGPIVVVGEMCGDHRRPPRPDFLRGRGCGRTDPGRPTHQLARTLIGQRLEPALPGWAATNDGSCMADCRLMTVARMKSFVFFSFLSRTFSWGRNGAGVFGQAAARAKPRTVRDRRRMGPTRPGRGMICVCIVFSFVSGNGRRFTRKTRCAEKALAGS